MASLADIMTVAAIITIAIMSLLLFSTIVVNIAIRNYQQEVSQASEPIRYTDKKESHLKDG